mmetsp:Transcript_36704/g.71648  ORF Transcript_36704/g.71648 Transcript_36704/m.71648 type:complete len:205 (+) Transcript_36704:1481-2095(+)
MPQLIPATMPSTSPRLACKSSTSSFLIGKDSAMLSRGSSKLPMALSISLSRSSTGISTEIEFSIASVGSDESTALTLMMRSAHLLQQVHAWLLPLSGSLQDGLVVLPSERVIATPLDGADSDTALHSIQLEREVEIVVYVQVVVPLLQPSISIASSLMALLSSFMRVRRVRTSALTTSASAKASLRGASLARIETLRSPVCLLI